MTARRARRLCTLLFYFGLFYTLYRIFLADQPELIPQETYQGETNTVSVPENNDSNIILRFLSYIFSIIPWAFSCLWGVMRFFWSIVVFLWGALWYIWTFFILALNVAYGILMFFNLTRNHQRSVSFFLIDAGIYLVVPLIVNWLTIRHELAFNLCLPVYLTLFVTNLSQAHDLRHGLNTLPRNLVFFVAICSLL